MDNIDVTSTANLYKSLAQAAPEIKQCVDACNFIADSKRQQNTIGSVSDDEKLISEHFVAISLYFQAICFPNPQISYFFSN